MSQDNVAKISKKRKTMNKPTLKKVQIETLPAQPSAQPVAQQAAQQTAQQAAQPVAQPAPAQPAQPVASNNEFLNFIINENMVDVIKVFLKASAKGHIGILKFLIETFLIRSDTHEFNENTITKGFSEACKYNKTDCMDYLFYLVKRDLCIIHNKLLNKEAFTYLINRCDTKPEDYETKGNVRILKPYQFSPSSILEILRTNDCNHILTLHNAKLLIDKGLTSLFYIVKVDKINEEVLFYLLSLEKDEEKLKIMIRYLCNHIELNEKIYTKLSEKFGKLFNMKLSEISNHNYEFLIRREISKPQIRDKLRDLANKKVLSIDKISITNKLIVEYVKQKNKLKAEQAQAEQAQAEQAQAGQVQARQDEQIVQILDEQIITN
jgi:ribosomal protein L23